MLYSDKIINELDYLDNVLPQQDHNTYINTNYQSRPCIVQLCGHDPDTLSKAALKVALTNRADAIDLNLGCPQDRAEKGLFGSFLLDKCHWYLSIYLIIYQFYYVTIYQSI
jgi:tRNA-dihydrouridine synthase 1